MNYSILHVITTIDLGGAEKQLLTLATCQSEKGFDVEVIFLKNSPTLIQDFLVAGVRVDSTFAKLGFFRQCIKLRRKKVQEGVVIHAHLPRAEILCALSLESRSFIVTRHNSEAFFPNGPVQLSKLLSRFVLKRAFALISISKAVTSYLKSSREMSESIENYVIPYGLKSTSVLPKGKKHYRTVPIQIGTVSRLVPQKNLPLLLGALKELNSIRSSHFELTILGTGPLERELRLMSVALGIENVVSWRGQTRDVMSFYRSLDIFVLPSDYEGFGLVLLEAMSQGIPVIARRISAIPEVMGDNHPGLVDSSDPLEMAKKIEEFTNNNIVLNCLEYQYKQLQKFSIGVTQAAHENIYLKLLMRSKRV